MSGMKFEKKNLKLIFGNIIVIATFAGLLIWVFQGSLPQVAVMDKDKEVMVAFLRIDKTAPWLFKAISYLADLSSPLAWLDTYLRTNGTSLNGSMRDTDRDRSSYLVVKSNKNIESINDLKGKTIGFGAIDSPQARLIPINHLHKNGLEFKTDYIEKRFDIGVGLHGDHVGGELDSAIALKNDEVAATWMLDLNYNAWIADGTLDKNQVKILSKTDFFDHCIFSGHPELDVARFEKFIEVLHKMNYNNPEHKEMMDMEGLKEWVSGRTSGFKQLTEANEYLDFFKEFHGE